MAELWPPKYRLKVAARLIMGQLMGILATFLSYKVLIWYAHHN